MRRFAGIAFVGLTLMSCVAGITTSVRYTPMNGTVGQPAKTISLKIVDDRDPKMGGREKNLVGQARGGYGNPFGVREARSENVTTLVRAATTDALLAAGVGIRDGSDRILVATIKKYWADGYMHYKAEIEVSCEVKGSDGRPIWKGSVRSEENGKLGMKPKTRLQNLYQDVLTQYAKAAAEEFKSAAFREAAQVGGAESGELVAGATLYEVDGTVYGVVESVDPDHPFSDGTRGVGASVRLTKGGYAWLKRDRAKGMLENPNAPPPKLAPVVAPSVPRAPTLERGAELVAADGSALGTVDHLDGETVVVNLRNGGQIKVPREKALQMLKKP